jgi:hypothetical protein
LAQGPSRNLGGEQGGKEIVLETWHGGSPDLATLNSTKCYIIRSNYSAVLHDDSLTESGLQRVELIVLTSLHVLQSRRAKSLCTLSSEASENIPLHYRYAALYASIYIAAFAS